MKKVDPAVFDYYDRLFADMRRQNLPPEMYFRNLDKLIEQKRDREARAQKPECETISHIRRRVLGLDQEAFARSLGVTRFTVSRWEREGKTLNDLSRRKREQIQRNVTFLEKEGQG